MSNNTDDNEKRPVTDERRSLYERAAAAADEGEIAAPERRPMLRTEETYATDENIIVRAARAQREVWEVIEQQAAEIERLRSEVASRDSGAFYVGLATDNLANAERVEKLERLIAAWADDLDAEGYAEWSVCELALRRAVGR